MSHVAYRAVLLLPPLLLCLAAGPTQNAPVSLSIGNDFSTKAPVPSLLPQPAPPSSANTPSGPVFTPAPTPDQDALVPQVFNLNKGDPSIGPGMFQQKSQYNGEGYVPGSTVQGDQGRKMRIAPGINLRVPLN